MRPGPSRLQAKRLNYPGLHFRRTYRGEARWLMSFISVNQLALLCVQVGLGAVRGFLGLEAGFIDTS